jgi:hypothetical protein
MKKLLIAFFLAALANGLPADFDNATEVGEAKQAIAAFAGALKSELLAAMQSGGAVNAIEVCNSSALEIRIARCNAVGRCGQCNRSLQQLGPVHRRNRVT